MEINLPIKNIFKEVGNLNSLAIGIEFTEKHVLTKMLMDDILTKLEETQTTPRASHQEKVAVGKIAEAAEQGKMYHEVMPHILAVMQLLNRRYGNAFREEERRVAHAYFRQRERTGAVVPVPSQPIYIIAQEGSVINLQCDQRSSTFHTDMQPECNRAKYAFGEQAKEQIIGTFLNEEKNEQRYI